MGESTRKRKLNDGILPPNMPQIVLSESPEPTVVKWSILDMNAAFNDLTILLNGNPEGDFGYKASVIRTVLEPFVLSAQRESVRLQTKYRKMLPAEGGKTLPAPSEVNGRPTPTDFWCTNPREYERKATDAKNVVHSIAFPVRFTYEEVRGHREPLLDSITGAIVAWHGIRGSFWRNLAPLIDPSPAMAQFPLPVIPPTFIPMSDVFPEETAS